MAGKPYGRRADRLERVVQIIVEGQVSLQKLIPSLAAETQRDFDRVAKRFKETDKHRHRAYKHVNQTDERIDKLAVATRRTDERTRQTDERIDKLVVAIGEFIRRQNGRGK